VRRLVTGFLLRCAWLGYLTRNGYTAARRPDPSLSLRMTVAEVGSIGFGLLCSSAKRPATDGGIDREAKPDGRPERSEGSRVHGRPPRRSFALAQDDGCGGGSTGFSVRCAWSGYSTRNGYTAAHRPDPSLSLRMTLAEVGSIGFGLLCSRGKTSY
jgi:hypothetical protein